MCVHAERGHEVFIVAQIFCHFFSRVESRKMERTIGREERSSNTPTYISPISISGNDDREYATNVSLVRTIRELQRKNKYPTLKLSSVSLPLSLSLYSCHCYIFHKSHATTLECVTRRYLRRNIYGEQTIDLSMKNFASIVPLNQHT